MSLRPSPALLVAGSRRRALAAALLAGLVLHNLEEGLTYSRYVAPAEAMIASLRGAFVTLPSVPAFHTMLVAVTLLGAGLLLWAARGPETAGRWLALRLVAAVLLLNLALPHVPAALLLGGYAPGLVTALLVDLPLALLVLRSSSAGSPRLAAAG